MTSRTHASNDTSTQKLLNELRSLMLEADEMLKSQGGDVGSDGTAAHGKLNAALETAKATYLNLQEKAVAGAKRTDTMIRDNPYQSMGIALGVGVLIGYLVTRSSK